jgi:hypothetical protein
MSIIRSPIAAVGGAPVPRGAGLPVPKKGKWCGSFGIGRPGVPFSFLNLLINHAGGVCGFINHAGGVCGTNGRFVPLGFPGVLFLNLLINHAGGVCGFIMKGNGCFPMKSGALPLTNGRFVPLGFPGVPLPIKGNGCFPMKSGAFPLTNGLLVKLGRPVVYFGPLVVYRGLFVYFGRWEANQACSSGNSHFGRPVVK